MQVVGQLSLQDLPDDVRVLSLGTPAADWRWTGSRSFHGIVVGGRGSRGSLSGRGTR